MENRKLVILSLFISVFFLPSLISAYDASTSHRLITDDAVAVFNRYFPNNKFSLAETQQILTGSIEEDNGLRSFAHFYDPVYGRGIVEAGVAYEASKKWAEDTTGQGGTAILGNLAAGTVSLYFGGGSDYSWDRAVYEYVYGDKNRGLQTLGHVLHLIEDATVPDHTRNDDHVPYYTQYTGQASPFEMYAKDQTGPTVNEVLSAGVQPIIYSSLDHYFDAVALYSNANFFSKDSILDKEYSGPVIVGFDPNNCKYKETTCSFLVSRNSDKLTLKIIRKEKGKPDAEEYYLNDDKNLILSSYYQNLSLQAIANSAGVIKLFFDAVEEEKRTGALALKNKSWLGRALALVGLTGDKATNTSPTTTPATTPPL
ncbi:MAG: hypothetical protein NT162_03125, partial [Candidatus Woesebacteria bacterium]|nr:hypothetical protein [Candidatus Woesebacteria bacterium]